MGGFHDTYIAAVSIVIIVLSRYVAPRAGRDCIGREAD